MIDIDIIFIDETFAKEGTKVGIYTLFVELYLCLSTINHSLSLVTSCIAALTTFKKH